MARTMVSGATTRKRLAGLLPWLLTLALGCSAGPTPDTGVGNPGVDAGPIDAGFAVNIDGGRIGYDIRPIDIPTHDIQPNFDAFFANNPPPMFCGPDGGGVDVPRVVLPGGTATCPADLNREGCACNTIGQTVSCWPGLRVNRNRGVCHDGMTTCMPYDEIAGRWGPCMGYTLPTPGVTLGAGACQCFSMGQWSLANTSPCIVQVGSTYYAVSTYMDAMGQAQCPGNLMTQMPPFMLPTQAFSTNTLRVDCTGEFQLCYTIRAGNAAHPSASDCVVGRTCTTAWYATSGAVQTLPPLPAWTSTDSTCATAFATTGGYGEMSVVGLSSECEHIDNMGQPYVFNRVTYCPSLCNDPAHATDPMCTMCGNGGSGGF